MSLTRSSEQLPETVSGSKWRWLNRTVIGLGCASFFSDVGHEMATTAMPILLATMGANSATLGVIEGLADGLSSLAKLFSGHWSDRLKRRKPLAVAGYLLTASGMASFAFASASWHVMLGRVLGWIGRGARSPIRAVLLTEATTPDTYGRAFGFERSMDSAGAIFGPLIALALVGTCSLSSTFLLTLIPGLLAAGLVAFAVREKPRTSVPTHSMWEGISALPKEFQRYLLGIGIAGIGDFSNTLLILWATQAWTPVYGLHRASLLAMSFYVGYNFVYTGACFWSGHLSDRWPRHLVLAAGYAIAIVPALALMLPGASLTKFAIVFGFSGLYMGFWETLEHTAAAATLPSDKRGVGFGVLATVNGVGDLVSSATVGTLWVLSPVTAMSFVILTSLVGAITIATSARAHRSAERVCGA